MSHSAGDNLYLTHCVNSNCSTGTSHVVVDSGDQVGKCTSLVLDAAGNPVISYYDRGNGTIKVAHCVTSTCAPEPTPTITPTPTPTSTPTSTPTPKPVGGIAEPPDVERAPLGASESPGGNTSAAAYVAAAATAGVALSGAALWAWRRRTGS